MVSTGVVVATKQRLRVRAILGLVATGISLLILVFPGQMILPLFALTPVTPHMGGCANLLAPVVLLAFFALGFMLSVLLIVIGIVAIVLTALQVRGGSTIAVVVNAIVATLLLVVPLGMGAPGGLDQSSLGLAVLMSAAAVFPLAGTVLLSTRSLYRSPRVYIATLVCAGLLLLPGAAGLTVLGLDLGGVAVFQAQNTTPVGQTAHC